MEALVLGAGQLLAGTRIRCVIGAGVWRCQRDLSSSTRAAHAVALEYSTEQLLERVWCAGARANSM